MSEPTYRIDTRYDPAYTYLVWFAVICRVTDGMKVYEIQAENEEEAIRMAQAYIARVSSELPTGRTLYVSEDGEIVPAPEPQSLRA